MKYNIQQIASKIRQQIKRATGKENFKLDTALILGSGLSGAAPQLTNKVTISYQSLGLPDGGVLGHSRNFVFGEYAGKQIALVSRIHYYERGNMDEMRLPFQLLSELGTKTVIMTTAVGGVDASFKAGDLMLIEDHINYTGVNPLIGIDKQWFVDMSNVYDKDLRQQINLIALEHNVALKSGVHMQFSGPVYETPAEVRMAALLGASTVSMSTALDAILCAHFGIKVVAIASVCNMAAGMSNEVITHERVLEASKSNEQKLAIILQQLLPQLA